MCSGKAASVNQYRNNGCGQVLYNNDTVPGRPLGIFYIRRIEMKKIIALIAAVTFLSIGFGNMAIAKNKCGNGNGNQNQHQEASGDTHGPGHGPAENAGDGVSDGSGMGHDEQGAPNSGDGVSDESGWDGDDNDK